MDNFAENSRMHEWEDLLNDFEQHEAREEQTQVGVVFPKIKQGRGQGPRQGPGQDWIRDCLFSVQFLCSHIPREVCLEGRFVICHGFHTLWGAGILIMVLQEAVSEVMHELIDEMLLGLCFEVHRACRLGTIFLDETDLEYELVFY